MVVWKTTSTEVLLYSVTFILNAVIYYNNEHNYFENYPINTEAWDVKYILWVKLLRKRYSHQNNYLNWIWDLDWGFNFKHHESAQLVRQGCYFFVPLYLSQLRRPIEFKFSQVCYSVRMLGYNKWEDWSWTITTYYVHCL